MKLKLLSALAAVAIFGAGVADAQVQISRDGRPERMNRIPHKKGLNQMDSMFLDKIAAGHNFEIALSRLAAERAGSAWARDFAKEMIHEHTVAKNELHTLCAKKGVDCDGQMGQKMINTIHRLRSLSGADFDREWREAQMAAHSDASNLLKKQIKSGRDEDIRSYAIKMLPPTIMHYKMAQTRTTMTGTNKMQHGM